MKNLFAIITFAVILVSFTSNSEAASTEQSLCDYINVDNKSKLRNYLKSNRLKIRNVFKGTSCNGKNILEFADEKNAINTGKMIIGKLSKKVVAEFLPTLASTNLVAIAEKRVNG